MIGALLLASVSAVPAMAQDQAQGGWHRDGGEREGRGGGNWNGGNRGEGGMRAQPAPGAPQIQRPDFQRPDGPRPDRPQGAPGGWQQRGDQQDAGHRVSGRPDNGVQVWRNDRGTAPRPDWNGQPNDRPDNRGGNGWDRDRDGRPDGGRPGNWSGGNGDRDRDGRPDWRDGNRGRPGDGWDRGRPGGGWDNGRPGWTGNRGGWNNGWRDDRRYDWRGWRDTHRDYFRAGRYRPPYGYRWGYRRWGIGVRIDPVFFAQDYWISDPGYYRLPPAYGSYRWVRYYNDALLIDIYSGIVVDEIPDFFW